MHPKRSILVAAVATAFLTGVIGAATPLATAQPTEEATYLVLFKGTSIDAATKQAIIKAGGTVTETNTKIGYA